MDFSWFKLEALSIDDLVRLEGLITREYTRREAEKVEKQAAMPPATPPNVGKTNIGKPLREIKRAIRPRQKTGPKPGTKARVLYQHPEVNSLTWAGRGKKPAWVRDWLESGGTLAQIRTFATPS